MSVSQIKQQGISLIESMIALVVISVGLLGIASLQLTAMGQNTSALNHSQAVWLAYNMSDRIRANNSQFLNYDGIDTSGSYSGDCVASACTPAQMLQADAAEWTVMLQSLPGGRGRITSNADGLLVTILWDDEGTGNTTSTNCNVDITCYTLAVTQ